MTQMEQVVIDTKKCTGCGLCVDICPYRALELVEAKARYTADDCFLCGHCHAVCPENSVTLPERDFLLGLTNIDESRVSLSQDGFDGEELLRLMRSRRSCRRYKDKRVPLSILEDLVKIGTTAPSGTNSQPWQFTILSERKDVMVLGQLVGNYYRNLNKMADNRFLRAAVKVFGGDSLGKYYRDYYESITEGLREWDEEGIDRLFHGAPAVILVAGQKEASCPAEDALLATQNILLASHALGLGTCLIGFAVEAMRRDKKIMNKMEIDDSEEIYSVIAIGYSAVTYKRPANRKKIVPRIPVLMV